jgi:hypothetical protein
MFQLPAARASSASSISEGRDMAGSFTLNTMEWHPICFALRIIADGANSIMLAWIMAGFCFATKVLEQ